MALSWLLHSAYTIVLGNPSPKITKEETSKTLKLLNGNNKEGVKTDSLGFQVPLHYPRYSKADYLKMEEWRLDLLLQQYGLNFEAKNTEDKRAFVMGAFLWPDQL